MPRWNHPLLQDAGLAVLLLIGTVPMITTVRGGRAAGIEPVLTGQLAIAWPRIRLLLILAGALAVAARRAWPIPALALATAVTVAQMAAANGPVPTDLAVPILLYTVAAHRRRAVSLGVLGALLAAAVGWSAYVALDGKPDELAALSGDRQGPAPAGTTRFGPTDWGGIPVLGSPLLVAWAVGWGMRSRRAYLGELLSRTRDLERERDQRAALAVAAERARITRELHDVVAHGLAVIVMQAQGGAAAFANKPSDTLAALETIVETGRASLADMRQVLSTIDAPTRPLPGVAQLPGLVEQVRQAGTEVRLHVDGEPRGLPSAVDVSAYRVVQEALTNVMKHAGSGASAEVLLAYRATQVEISVTDDGVGDRGGSGNGLRGMRERLAVLGGSVSAGSSPGGGYAVRATIPVTVVVAS
ncbi:histidine kinase [Actinoplanes sp. NPDC051851]|uniref:sensor histidine kinase n=1 Tax=Actinoplanes sp. NPDC051851 TaxID=3154753 RepID=UPI003438C13E